MKKLFIISLAALGLCASALNAPAQVTATINKSALGTPIECLTVTTNLPGPLLTTNIFTPGKHLGVGVILYGGNATNTGTTALQFNAMFGGTNGLVKTTTKPFTIPFTANGTTVVKDWYVIPDYTLGPCDGLVLGTITNATVNYSSVSGGAVIVSNVWLEYR